MVNCLRRCRGAEVCRGGELLEDEVLVQSYRGGELLDELRGAEVQRW